MEIIGVIGGILLLLAWVFETEEALRKHKKLIDLKFAFIYITGIIFMIFYSITISNGIFIMLNSVIFAIVLFEIIYTLQFKIFKSWHKSLINAIFFEGKKRRK